MCSNQYKSLINYHYLIVSDISFTVQTTWYSGPRVDLCGRSQRCWTRNKVQTSLWHSRRLSSSLPWTLNGNSGNQVYVYCQGCGPQKPWPLTCEPVPQGEKNELTQEMCLLSKKQRQNELFKLEPGLILENCPQITLNARLCMRKTTGVAKNICYSLFVLWNNTADCF